MTQEDSMDWEEFEIVLNDERGPQIQIGSKQLQHLQNGIVLRIGNHNSSPPSEAIVDDSTC